MSETIIGDLGGGVKVGTFKGNYLCRLGVNWLKINHLL